VNELRDDCRLERVNLRHKKVRKHVTVRNIVINTSRLIVIMQQFSNGRPTLTRIYTCMKVALQIIFDIRSSNVSDIMHYIDLIL